MKKLEKGNKVRVLKLRSLKKVGTSQRIDTSEDIVMNDASNQGRMIDDLDKDDVVALMEKKKKRRKKRLRVAAASTRRRKEVVIRDPEEESTASTVIPANTKSKDKGKGIMQKAKEDPTVQRYQAIKRKLMTEAQARRNMIMYLKNVVGFRLDYFKGLSYDDIHQIFKVKFNLNVDFLINTKEQMEEEESRAIQSINETPAQKAAKRRKLNEEVEDLKRHLEIVPDEDDDIYTEATLLVKKVPVMDYKIIHLNNKPPYKIIRADGTHQLFPNNFSDDFLLTTLGAIFKREMDRLKSGRIKGLYMVKQRLRAESYWNRLSAVKQKMTLLDSAVD
nr:hypothetical protein [Tanacetum cinerariifolium]